MAEVSDNAAIFIATSFQAMERAKFGIPPDAITVNLMISLVFLGFYLEENLDVIITRLSKDDELRMFFHDKSGRKKLGLLNKFGWFYNFYVTPSSSKLEKSKPSFMNDLVRNIETRFPGFEKIYTFRNPVSHGKIEHSLSIPDVNILRERAKAITDELLEMVKQKTGVVIEKSISYKDAFTNFDKTHPAI